MSLSAFGVISILNVDCLTDVPWNLNDVLICISLTKEDIRASFHALVICVSSIGKTAEKISGILFNQIVHVLTVKLHDSL